VSGGSGKKPPAPAPGSGSGADSALQALLQSRKQRPHPTDSEPDDAEDGPSQEQKKDA